MLNIRRGPYLTTAALAAGVAGLVMVACAPPQRANDVSSQATKACSVDPPAASTTVNLLAFSAPAIDPFTNAMVKGCAGVQNLKIAHTPVDFTGQIQKAELALSSKGKSPYAIVEAYNSTMIKYASEGWILPLDDLIAKYKDQFNLGDISPQAWENSTYEGKVYGLPNQINTQVLIYRKDLFDASQITVPTDYDSFLAAAKKLQGKVDYPAAMAWGADDAVFDGFHGWLTANGGQWFTDQNTAAFDSKAGQDALTQMKTLLPYMPKDSLTFGNGDVMGLFQQGKVGMTVIWATRAGPIDDPKTSKVAGKLGFAPAPKGTAGKIPAGETSVDGFVIAKNSGLDPELLFRIIASTTVNADVQKAAAGVAIPSRTSLQEDQALAKPVWPAAVQNIRDGAEPLPAVPYADPLAKSVVNPYLVRGISGASPVDQALSEAAAALDKTLKSKGYTG